MFSLLSFITINPVYFDSAIDELIILTAIQFTSMRAPNKSSFSLFEVKLIPHLWNIIFAMTIALTFKNTIPELFEQLTSVLFWTPVMEK